ncbi:unnamed protein product [Aphanomyces euteiches]|uniref:AAA domain-containing protein n=1 Tax=Aphanomyces euteiches TaxID=100861 RepID=A0A6G0X5X1_9STRA|nr:hypothetical protein Ae201684_008082 [Aphanomyces euteiches]KAH9074496.1 hypothetical protein Ae201684P_022303 [Aphanomyces euteiches]KAH9156001.1 hypothetical protein AeRB84_002065 [Aphanomyces euteiches]
MKDHRVEKVQVVGDGSDFAAAEAFLEGLSFLHEFSLEAQSVPGASLEIHVIFSDLQVKSFTSVDTTVAFLRHVFEFSAIPPSLSSPSSSQAPSKTSSRALRLFIGGDKSQVGKSTVCLGLLGSLLELGYKPSELAYIKPATQCELPQLVSRFCEHYGIDARPIGPVVFYSGFTRSFLEQPNPTQASTDLLAQIVAAVDEISKDKRVVLIDGVGYPSVGSICGISNADVAAALSPISVVLVGKPGVGDAIDSFNLNATYFASKNVRVLGGIFNRLPTDGFYSLENCKLHVSRYFSAMTQGRQKAYGFIPDMPQLKEEAPPENETSSLPWTLIVDSLNTHVDVSTLVRDAEAVQTATPLLSDSRTTVTVEKSEVEMEPTPVDRLSPSSVWKPSRETIQAEARQAGAGSS